jgi:hypothetical protein
VPALGLAGSSSTRATPRARRPRCGTCSSGTCFARAIAQFGVLHPPAGPDAFPNLLGFTPLVEYAPSKQAGVIYKGVSLYNTAANHPIFFDVETSGSSEAINSQKIWYIGLLAGHDY